MDYPQVRGILNLTLIQGLIEDQGALSRAAVEIQEPWRRLKAPGSGKKRPEQKGVGLYGSVGFSLSSGDAKSQKSNRRPSWICRSRELFAAEAV